MKSPFRGMDPYLEARWPDAHLTLIAAIQETLQPRLPKALRARATEKHLADVIDDTDLASYCATIAVVQAPAQTDADIFPVGTKGMIEPIAITLEEPEIFDRFVQIIDTTSGNRVVTAIEVLSPWNKLPGRLNDRYLKKLADYQRAGVNIVEIDLLRIPRDHLLIRHTHIPAKRRAAYMTCVYFSQPQKWYAYPMPLREPLGTIPVPLRPQDSSIGLELQPLIDRVYAAGAHDDIDYMQPASPALSGEDATWAQGLVAAPRIA